MSSSQPAADPSWRCALAAMLPAAIALSLVAGHFGAAPTAFVPDWSDEIVYWNEASVFARAGFGGGYVTVHEQPAAATFSRFGPHGPAFAVLQGSVARVFGWQPYSAFLLNLALVTLAAFVWLRYGARRVSWASVLLLATFWPLLLYLPTNMQEPTHFALAFVFALTIVRWQRRPSRALIVATVTLVVAAALLRPTWALMVLPIGWRFARAYGARGLTALLVLTGAATAGAYAAFSYLAAPYPNLMRTLAKALAMDPRIAVGLLEKRAAKNMDAFFRMGHDLPVEIVLRYFIAALLAILAIRWYLALERQSEHISDLEVGIAALLPVVATALMVGSVEMWRDFRLLAPHLLVALLLIAAASGWERWLWAGTLVFLPSIQQTFVNFHTEHFTVGRAAIADMRSGTGDALAFTPGAPPWDNTVLMHGDLVQQQVLALPPGVGVSIVLRWRDMKTGVRSRYLLLRSVDRDTLAPRVRLTPLRDTPFGVLYLNAGAVASATPPRPPK